MAHSVTNNDTGTMNKSILLNPEESDFPWLGLIVERKTGVVYVHQYGGVANLHGEIEGFYVPLFAPDAHETLLNMFHFELQQTGQNRSPYRWLPGQRERVVDAIESIDYWASDDIHEKLVMLSPHTIEEAWVPVKASDGPGVLVWENTD